MKIVLLTLFLYVSVFAGEYSKAQENYLQSSKIINGVKAFKTEAGWLAFSSVPLTGKGVIRSNHYLGLYLLQSSCSTPSLKVINKNPKEVVALWEKNSSKNSIVQEQYGLDGLAQLKEHAKVGSVVMGHCATLRGFVAQEGVVTSRYINDFLYKKDAYASLGMRLEASKQGMRVESVNPFFAYNPFKKGDIILYHNGKKESLYELNDLILRSKVGTKHFFLVERDKSAVPLVVISKRRFGGGVQADTFLEFLGVIFSKDMHVVSVAPNTIAAKYDLKKFDKLISVNGYDVTSDKALRNFFSTHSVGDTIDLLMQRDGLQFFIHIPNTKCIEVE